MKSLCVLLLVSLYAVPLPAQQVPVLTELEQVQEKLWYLQRDIAALQDALETERKQRAQLAADLQQAEERRVNRFDETTATLAEQRQTISQVETTVEEMGEALATLTSEMQQQNATFLEQAQRLEILQEALDSLRAEISDEKTVAGEGLTELQTEVAAVRGHLGENRTRLSQLEQDMKERFERLIYYGGGAALGLVILMAIGFAVLKSRESPI